MERERKVVFGCSVKEENQQLDDCQAGSVNLSPTNIREERSWTGFGISNWGALVSDR